ncbi:MAG: VacJ family lipoprotein [Bacteroidota bacterium]
MFLSIRPRRFYLLCSMLSLLALSACGTTRGPAGLDAAAPADAAADNNAHDPLEGFNRAMYTFNDKLDRYVLKPVAKGYRKVTPTPVRRSISNFFGNLHDPAIMLNNLLQGKPKQAASDFSRFFVNSTIGIFGLFDVATKWELPKHDEDFGQTLAVWGVGDGPYLVLPFFGPSNMRDAPALVVDWETYPPNQMKDSGTRDKMFVLEVVDGRAKLLEAGDILEQAAGQDPYVFVREAYRQRRSYLVYDGNPPQAAPPPGLFEDDETAPAAPAKPAAPQNAPQSR